jgi:hypothetical protein
VVNEGPREVAGTDKRVARSFTDEGLVAGRPHAEFIIDRQGDIRARGLTAVGNAWTRVERLASQVEILIGEKPRASAPGDNTRSCTSALQ